MSKTNKGFMLLEMILAVVLLGLIIGAVNLYSKYIGVIYRDVDKSAIVSMAQLGSGVEYIVQRIVHTDTRPFSAECPDGIEVKDNGKKITFTVLYQGAKRKAEIYFVPAEKKVYYDYNTAVAGDEKVFLTNIKSVLFSKEVEEGGPDVAPRLAIKIEAEHEPYPITIRTSVVGRNRPMPGKLIN